MRRCLRPGCPTQCGTRRTPSCATHMVYYALLIILTSMLFMIAVSSASKALKMRAEVSGLARQ